MEAVPAKKTINRRITDQDVQAMAELLAKRITETGACLILGLKPETWFKWKIRAKHSGNFEKVLTHVRESKLNATIETIDAAGNPYEVVTKSGATFMRPGDWRAKAFMVERILAPDRFGDKQQAGTASAPLMAEAIMDEITKRILESRERKRADAVVECPPAEVKQIQ